MSADGDKERPRAAAKSKCGKIDRTNITVQQVEDTLRERLGTDAVFESWDYVEIGKGKGFVSCMVRVDLTWTPDDEKLPKSVVVKIPDLTNFKAAFGGDDPMMKMFLELVADNLQLIHNGELRVYGMFGAMPRGDWPVPLAKCYGGREIGDNQNPDGYLILEDLSKVTACVDMSEGYSYEQTKSLMEALARFHAWCLGNDSTWRGLTVEYDIEKLMGPMIDSMIKAFDAFAVWAGEPKQKDFFGAAAIARVGELKPDLSVIKHFSTMHREHGLPDILVHGDFWSNNILMHCDADTMLPTDEIRAIIDWQGTHAGSPGEDIARLLLMSCDSRLRADHTDDLLRLYHERLRFHLGGAEPPFSLPKLTDFYERMFVGYAGGMMPFCQQMIAMIDSGHFIKTSDPEKMKKKFLEDCRSTVVEALRLKDKFDCEK